MTTSSESTQAVHGRVRTYRFHQAWFRKASCDLCRCLIKRSHVEDHAEWHARRNEGGQVGAGTIASYKDVTLTNLLPQHVGNRSRFLLTTTGWITTSTGPR